MSEHLEEKEVKSIYLLFLPILEVGFFQHDNEKSRQKYVFISGRRRTRLVLLFLLILFLGASPSVVVRRKSFIIIIVVVMGLVLETFFNEHVNTGKLRTRYSYF
jgi:hypothetical protein